MLTRPLTSERPATVDAATVVAGTHLARNAQTTAPPALPEMRGATVAENVPLQQQHSTGIRNPEEGRITPDNSEA